MLDESRFDVPLLDATVLVASDRPQDPNFGSGFIVGHADGAALVLTCAHVVRDVAGDHGDQLTANRLPATVLAIGTPEALDLALLRVPGLTGDPLPLLPPTLIPVKGQTARVIGYQGLGSAQRLQNPRSARFGNMARLSTTATSDRAWAWWLLMGDEGGLEKGFSGGPVFDLATGYVAAVVSLRQGASAGLAICASELPQIWPAAAGNLFSSQRLPEPVIPVASPSPDLARRVEELDAATRATLPPNLQPLVGAIADRVAEAVARAMSLAQPTAYVPLPPENLDLIAELAGRTVKASDTTLSFGDGSQFGDVKIDNAVGRDQISVSFYLQSPPPEPARPGSRTSRSALERPIRLYTAADADVVAQLAVCRQLAARGLSVARTSITPRLSSEALRAELDDASAAMIWLTPQAIIEPALYGELHPALAAARASQPELPIMVVLDEVEEHQLRARPAELGATLARPADLPRELFLRMARPAFGNLRARGEAALHLAAHPEAALEQGGDMMLDWLEFFTPLPADEETWRETLLPALRDGKRALTMAGVRSVAIRAQARLSVGMALGYVYRQSSGFRLRIDQRGQWWSTDAPVADDLPLVAPGLEDGPGGPDLSIEVSSSRWDASKAVERWMARNPGVIGQRWRCKVTAVELGAGQAFGIAGVIAQVMEDAKRGPQPPGTIHFFGAMPLGLAALIGWRLNVCEPVQCYDAIDNNRDYQAACKLE